MITNGEFVSRVVNGIHALDKDSHVSRRWILNIGRTKAESYTAQRWDDGTLLGDHRLLTYVTCLEMIEVDKIVCCDAEFALCYALMRSKHKLPGLLYSALRPAITKVTNVDNTIFFKFAEIKSYRNEQKRPYAKYVKERRPFYYVENDYIYIPDFHIELINVEFFTTRRKKALELMACDPTPKGCESEWEYEFICPIKLIEYVVAETIKEVAFRLQIPVDENPNLDSNQKSQIVQ